VREIRQHGSEGGGPERSGLPTPNEAAGGTEAKALAAVAGGGRGGGARP